VGQGFKSVSGSEVDVEMVTTKLIQVAYRFQRWAWRVFRPRTTGVKVMLFNPAGDLVLVRNSYGRSDLFVLPGGGLRPFEAPARAAVREMREELGVEIDQVSLASLHATAVEGKRDTIHLFTAVVDQQLVPDPSELAEARFAAPGDLPSATSPATRRRVEEYLGQRAPDGTW
jgi:8-oxo-dGTP pyrophosphatase MutT (NUDIX family)